MKVFKNINLADSQLIAESVQNRMDEFDETLTVALAVVLLNYGSNFVNVMCTQGEWKGVKGDLSYREGIPLCPNGHPLLELGTYPRLALVQEDGTDNGL